MADKTIESKSGESGGRGREKESDGAEVAGRGRQALQTCFNCGAENYVDPNWSWFTCWKCALKKPLPLPGH
ncbi:MAG: hypothetical protein QOF24_348 [Verrucomicrobiota bacterium]|jgi:hypothetical protein